MYSLVTGNVDFTGLEVDVLRVLGLEERLEVLNSGATKYVSGDLRHRNTVV